MTESSDPSLLKRARDVLASMGEARSQSILDAVTRGVNESLERWRDSSALRRFLGVPPGRDQVIAAGGTAWLEARVGPIVQMGAGKVRFFIDDEDVGTCELSERGPSGLEIPLDTPGLHTLRLEPLSSAGTSLGPRGVVGQSRIQVVDRGPVLAIDAALVLEPPPVNFGWLRTLPSEGVQLLYFDLDPTDRSEAIRAAITHAELPDAALLTHPDGDKDVDPGSVDLSRVFGLTTVRRLRCAGVPVVGVVTRRQVDRNTGLPIFAPGGLSPEVIAAAKRHATVFCARRAATDPLTWRLDEGTDTRLVTGNDLSPEFDNRMARDRVFALVDAAERSIHLQTYMFQEGEVSNALVVRLIQRARAGVRVRVIVDALYSGEQVLGRKNPLLDSLALEANVEVVVGSPIAFGHAFDSVALKQRDHRKLMVFDGRIGFVSGRNIGDPYYRGFDETPIHQHTSHDHIPWLDAHVEARGPIVDEIQAAFRAAWLEYGGRDHTDLEPEDLPPKGTCAARLVVHNGLVDANAMLQYEAMLDAACDHVYIVNDFPIVPSLASAMLRALARGVRISLLTGNAVARRADGTFFPGPVYRELFDYMVKQRLEPLIRRGARVYEYVAPEHPMVVAEGGEVRPYVHAKVLTCDGKAASIGSANLDATASYWEHEANVVVQDEAFSTDLEKRIEAMIARAHVIDLDSDYWKRDRSKRAIVSKLWPEVVYS